MKSNICVIGLEPKYTKEIAKKLSDKLEMFFADIDELIEFDLIDSTKTEKICGREYLLKIEKNKVKTCCSYENTLLTMGYSILNNESNIEAVRNSCLLIYLKLSHEKYYKLMNKKDKSKSSIQLDNELFDDRDFICTNICDIIIRCDNLKISDILNSLLDEIYNYYRK